MPETKSTNTLQNMKFSKELINNDKAKIAFSTTNYHVFRSGILQDRQVLKPREWVVKQSGISGLMLLSENLLDCLLIRKRK